MTASNLEDPDYLKEVGTFKHGSIRKVTLTNFLTYSYVEFNAGPRLNMVVGPNGTGKSSILCAICLGLGGEPRLLGRASEIETFVMNGESEGQIQIELEDTEGNANPIITRTLRREGNKKQRSIFTWDGNMVSGKTVRQTCLDRYKITVDNLCTFLPQDRVGSFSGFDSKQLLLETEKSLSANQHLYTTHLNLIKEQQDLSGGDDQVETLTERIQQLAAETKRFKREKERMEERQAAKDQSDLLKKKLLWLEFDNKRNATFELKDAKAEKKKLAVAAMNNAAPAEQKHEELEKKLANQEQIFKALDSEVKMHQATMKKQHGKYETFDDGIEQILLDLNGLDTQRKMQEQKVEKARQKVEELEHQLSQFNSIENLDEEIAQVTEERKQIHPMFQSAKKELQKLEEKSRQIQDERKRLEGKWRKLQDEKAQRRANIFRQQPVLKKIVDWLSQNRNKFRKEVVGPICCEIATKSKNAAAYVEMQCANSTLKAFVVQTKEDYDLLYNTVRRKLKLPINVIFVPRVETRRREYSDEKINILKRDHGIIGYLDQSFTAPQVVMQALTNYHNVDKVLVGSEQTQNSIDSRGLSKYLSEAECGSGRARNFSIFTPQGEKSFQYTANVSKYSKKVNLRIDDVRPAKWLAPGVSEESKEKAKRELDDCNRQLEEIQPAVEEKQSDMQKYQVELQRSTQSLKAAKEHQKQYRTMMSKMQTSKRKLKAEEAKLEVDNEVDKKGSVDQLKRRLHASLQALDAHSEAFKKMMSATEKSSAAKLNKEVVLSAERQARQERDRMLQELDRARREYEDVSQRYTRSRKELQAMKVLADENAPLVDDKGEDLPLKDQLEDLPVESAEECKAAIEEADAKWKSIESDERVFNMYEQKMAELTHIEEELENLTSSRGKRITEMQQNLAPWEQELDVTIASIDKKFGGYMRELGCTGEVALTKAEPQENEENGSFKDWGIEIRVSFREGVKPSVLSARVQSGGERSVSTIMYLMALQERMVCPFRCVDEINQGLDERNERLVFKRIVENSCQPPGRKGTTDHCGQYFLITPKLLPNLFDMEVEAMTVQCIFNGAYNLKHASDWDVDKLIALRERRTIENEADGDQENSPNIMSENESPKKRRKVNA